jgi:DNA-binding transcriptional ArsR family regulator
MVTYSADPFRAVADPTRRAVLEYLLGRPHGVNELAEHFDVSRPAISKHLRILKDARVVRERREGRNRIYELNPAGLNALREYFDRFWSEALDAFKHEAERSTRKRGRKHDDHHHASSAGHDRPPKRVGES